MPGIGKTTSIHCLAHALLGDSYKEGVLELNASDERYVLPSSQWLSRIMLLIRMRERACPLSVAAEEVMQRRVRARTDSNLDSFFL